MNNVKEFIHSLKGVLSALDAEKTAAYRIAAFRERFNEEAGRRLRRAATANVTELDMDVLGDLMKVIKKLGKDSVDCKDNIDRRFKMTLELLDYAVSKKSPTPPDQIIWLFNKLYSGISKYVPTTQPTTEGVM